MPTLPIYIRVDDLEKWKALTNKSEFIHNALNKKGNALDAYKEAGGDPEFVISSKKDLESQFDTKPKIIKTAKDVPFETFFKKGKN